MDPDNIRRVVEQYSDLLLHIALTRTDSAADAEDVVQDAFLKLLTCGPRFRDEAHEKAWLIRTTLYLSYDLRRSASRRNVPLEEAADTETETVPPLLSAVRSLPDKYGAIIHLHYYEGYTIREISKLLRLPAATVGTRLARGRERLKQLLEEEYL